MGNRLSKIYTRTGDDGSTGLGDGTRVAKDSLRVAAYGTTDELNSVLGLLLSCDIPDAVAAVLTEIQHDLFDLGGELCIPGHKVLKPERVEALEAVLDDLNAPLEPLKDFILPGGSQAAAYCHLARTVCRRAERVVVSLSSQDPEGTSLGLRYLNRLSDLLFVMARSLNRAAGVGDVLWDRQR
ncbi:MAG: cob(I)yrinic acid a,c-diamide adenosyltransferase [Pseudomonadota bacterium]|nr:cob(I)yrinic acid a,c-diamide adenosyltransferase [Pseudomonadota bacterium]